MRRYLAVTVVCVLGLTGLSAADKPADKPEDTPAAAKTRGLLKKKVTLTFKDTRLADIIDEIKEEHVKGIKISLDTRGGVSQNTTITYSCKDIPLEEAFDGMFKKNGLGYIVISQKGNAYDGSVKIKQGKERGYPLKDK